MALNDTRVRVLIGLSIALLLLVLAFFVGRGSSSQAALPTVREQPAKDVATLRHAPLRAIGSVPALPREKKKKTTKKKTKKASSPPPPPAVSRPVVPPAPVAAPPPPPPPPPCVGEIC